MSTHKATDPLVVFPFSWSYTNFFGIWTRKDLLFLALCRNQPRFLSQMHHVI